MRHSFFTQEPDNSEIHDINVTPFIDIMLVLLIIFMVAAPLSTVDLNVNLPSSAVGDNKKPDKPIYLTVKTLEEIYLDKQPVSLAQLADKLNQQTQGNKQTAILFRGDKSTNYQTVIKIMAYLQKAGYNKIGLVALAQPE